MQVSLDLIPPHQDTRGNALVKQYGQLHRSQFFSKLQAPHPATTTPFDCCALSFQPFTHPVCARNSDGTGHVFDLVNIIPWLKYVVRQRTTQLEITLYRQAAQQHAPHNEGAAHSCRPDNSALLS
jgi:hypothetical protein